MIIALLSDAGNTTIPKTSNKGHICPVGLNRHVTDEWPAIWKHCCSSNPITISTWGSVIYFPASD